jgi:hypothetical protein
MSTRRRRVAGGAGGDNKNDQDRCRDCHTMIRQRWCAEKAFDDLPPLPPRYAALFNTRGVVTPVTGGGWRDLRVALDGSTLEEIEQGSWDGATVWGARLRADKELARQLDGYVADRMSGDIARYSQHYRVQPLAGGGIGVVCTKRAWATL